MLESYVSKRRNRQAALKVLLTKCGSAHEIVTDKLGSYVAALRDLRIINKHQTGQYKNNQVEKLASSFPTV